MRPQLGTERLMTSEQQRRAQALEYHLAGSTYQELRILCGYQSTSSAYRAVQKALDELGEPVSVEEVRADAKRALHRIDAMRKGVWGKARKGDLKAIETVLKLDERRSKILAKETAAKAAQSVESEGAAVYDLQRRLEERRLSSS